jgi:hypothetical protein
VSIQVTEVSDPDRPGERIQVKRNWRVDSLLKEYSHRHISRDAYIIGLRLQEILERAYRTNSSEAQWRERVDVPVPNSNAFVLAFTTAEPIRAYECWMVEHLGTRGAYVLRKVLVEGWTYGQVAAAISGRSTKVDASFVAKFFRMSLEDLATAWCSSEQEF